MNEEWKNVFDYVGELYSPIKDMKEFRRLHSEISNSENLFEKAVFVNFVFSNSKEAEKDNMYNSFLKNHELYIKFDV